MNFLTKTVARILYALPFGIFGINHFVFGSNMGGFVPSWVPGGVFWVYFTGAAMIIACVFIIGKIKYANIVSLLLALLLLIFILTIHVPGLFNEQMKQFATTSLLKDIALLGGALTYAGILAPKS